MKSASFLLVPATVLLLALASSAGAATINVNTTADTLGSDGACSLREAVISANNDASSYGDCTAGSGGDTISLGAGEYVLSITSTDEDASLDGDLDILDSVTIEGAGAASTIINGDSVDRLFHIKNSVSVPEPSVVLSGLTMTKGHVPSGSGGCIYAYGPSLVIRDSIINSSSTSTAGGVSIALGTLDITNSTISGNTANTGDGGGVYVFQSTAKITNSTISGNTTGIDGGGVYVTSSGTVNIANSTISGNTAGEGGGSIYVWYSDATITNSTMDGNSSGLHGGGVCVDAGTAEITNSTISGSDTGIDGGGVCIINISTVAIANSTISGSTAGGDGGGIYIWHGYVKITNSTISGNTIETVVPYDNGGGVFVGNSSFVEIMNTTISGNYADEGGGIYLEDSSVFVGGSILSGNSIFRSGPECFFSSGSTLTSRGYNILNDVSSGGCVFDKTGDHTRVDPMLGPLADNGGPTFTHALLEGSPAIDAGDPACTGTDQRGTSRPQDGDDDGSATCDIGAFEYVYVAPPPGGGATNTTASGGGGGCFIATAAYGSYMDDDVIALRRLRDEVLLTNPMGRALVSAYYAVSPPVADYIAEHPALRAATRIVLKPVVHGVKYPVAIGFIVTVGGLIALRRRKE